MEADHLHGRGFRIAAALIVLAGLFFVRSLSREPAVARAQEHGVEAAATPPEAIYPVQFYKNAQFGGGTCYGDVAGNYPTFGDCTGFDNAVSSLVLKTGWSVRVYQDTNQFGANRCFTATDDDLSNDTFEDGSPLDNRVSSFTLYARTTCPSLIPPPGPPVLLSPGNGASYPHSYNLTFQWQFSSGATEYLLEWWGGPYTTKQLCGWQSAVTCAVGTLPPDNTYSWHVKARNGTGESGWSPTWSFTIRPVPPAAFKKISPTDGVAGQSISPTLVWEASSGATLYEYYLVPDGAGTCAPWMGNGTSTSKVLSGLAPNSTYHWHVRAVNGGGTTNSDGTTIPWSFTTGTDVDTFEPDNSAAQASAIVPGVPQTHTIIPVGDVDWVRFTLGETSTVTLETTGAVGGDTEMWLYNASLAQLRYSNDEGAGAYSLIGVPCGSEALTAGTYYVKVAELGSNAEIPSYILRLSSSACPPPPPAPTFEDVPTAYWAWSFIERLYDAGITGGCSLSPLRYCPEGIVTRAQMAIFLERGIHGSSYSPPPVGSSSGFGDVPASHWAAAWIKQLAADGITGGCGNGNYCPEAPVTRAQMAIFLLRSKHGAAYVPPAVGNSTGFGDVPASHWSAAWIKQLVAEGITAGCGNGNYCPEVPVTRAQMAVFLVRTFSLP